MARCLIASSVCASKKSWGLARKEGKETLSVIHIESIQNTVKHVNRRGVISKSFIIMTVALPCQWVVNIHLTEEEMTPRGAQFI